MEGIGLWSGPLTRTDVVRWDRPRPRELAAITQTRLVVYTTPHKLWSYDFKTSQWDIQATPEAFFSVKATRDGFVYATTGNGAVMFGSADWGRSWQRFEVPSNEFPPVFRDRERGYASAWAPLSTSKMRLLKTTDGAKSWSEVGDIGFYPRALLFDPQQRALVAVGEQGRTLVSRDEGRDEVSGAEVLSLA